MLCYLETNSSIVTKQEGEVGKLELDYYFFLQKFEVIIIRWLSSSDVSIEIGEVMLAC